MTQDEWPEYRVGNRDYIHALGVIASCFNLLEFRFRSLFGMYIWPSRMAYSLFAKQTNQLKLDLMRLSIDASSHPDPIKEDVRYFLAGFKTCTDNRNVLMHSTVFYLFGPDDEPCPAVALPHQQPKGLGFQKMSRGNPFQIKTYELTIEEIRAIADGDRLFWHIWRHYETASFLASGFAEAAQHALPNRPAPPPPLIPLPRDTATE